MADMSSGMVLFFIEPNTTPALHPSQPQTRTKQGLIENYLELLCALLRVGAMYETGRTLRSGQ